MSGKYSCKATAHAWPTCAEANGQVQPAGIRVVGGSRSGGSEGPPLRSPPHVVVGAGLQTRPMRTPRQNQYTGRYGVSHCAMTVNLFVKISAPMTTSSAPDTSSILW